MKRFKCIQYKVLIKCLATQNIDEMIISVKADFDCVGKSIVRRNLTNYNKYDIVEIIKRKVFYVYE